MWSEILIVTFYVTQAVCQKVKSSSNSYTTSNSAKSHYDNASLLHTLHHESSSEDKVEFQEYCSKLFTEIQGVSIYHGNITNCSAEVPGEYKDEDSLMIFSLAMMILYGAIIRCFLKYFSVPLPHTVVLMVSGLVIGLWSKFFCDAISPFTTIARVKPKIILYTFLPVLVFESAFSIPSHTFTVSSVQILIIALPGMIISTFLTALASIHFLTGYKWSFVDASLFGSIISATDPVAVVAILRELGVSETLSVLIEGESLLNDGVAVLLYEIFVEILEDVQGELQDPWHLCLHIVLMFIRISIGGPVFGYLMGKLAIFFLARVFNDAVVEITITLVAAYLTYFIGEYFLGVSGIMGVVILGLTLGSEKTCISADSEAALHHFWEMFGYLANTVLFFIVGIMITETSLTNIVWKDAAYLLTLYVTLAVIRLVMLLLLSPILRRVGYGLEWQNILVMTWGGLRGAIGLCLALELYENPHLCSRKELAPKILFQTAGIVFLTLVINGTTTEKLMTMLEMTTVSGGREEEMKNIVKHLLNTRKTAIAVMKRDRFFLTDANWDVVEKYTKLANPYAKTKAARNSTADINKVSSLVLMQELNHTHNTKSTKVLTSDEFKELTEEVRLKIIKGLKISYWKQFEQGIIKEMAVQILVDVCSRVKDQPPDMIAAEDLERYWTVEGKLFPWLQNHLVSKQTESPTDGNDILKPPFPVGHWRYPFWWLSTRAWFDVVIIATVVLKLIPAFWEFALEIEHPEKCDTDKTFLFPALNFFFTSIYVMEFTTKIIGHGFTAYFTNAWNYIDLFVLIISLIDSSFSFLPCDQNNAGVHIVGIMRIFRLCRIAKSLRLLRSIVPSLLNLVTSQINKQLYLGYDVGRGFITSIDYMLKILPQLTENTKIVGRFQSILERERLETIRELGLLQRTYPGIALAVKTRHASRSVLNRMKSTLTELKKDGLIGDKESGILMLKIEGKMKKLFNAPASLAAFLPEAILSNLSWLRDNEDLRNYIMENASLCNFSYGETIFKAGVKNETNNGIYVIVSGLCKIEYIPFLEVIKDLHGFGSLPNSEIFGDFTFTSSCSDYVTSGSVLGELGLLKGNVRAATVICETFVTAYHIPLYILKEALNIFSVKLHDSLESRIWKAHGMRLATSLFQRHPSYESWTVDKIQMFLERSTVPILATDHFPTISIPDYIADVILIEGFVQDYHSKELYIAPYVIPKTCMKLIMKKNAKTVNRLLVVAFEDIDDETLFDEDNQANGHVSISAVLRKRISFQTGKRMSLEQRRLSIAINQNHRRISIDSTDTSSAKANNKRNQVEDSYTSDTDNYSYHNHRMSSLSTIDSLAVRAASSTAVDISSDSTATLDSEYMKHFASA